MSVLESVNYERTERAAKDLDWVPAPLKLIRWMVAGGLWAGLGGTSLATLAFKGVRTLAASSFYAGDRAARALLRWRLHQLAYRSVEVAALDEGADGELVHIRGRVRARRTIQGLLAPHPTVFRRMVFTVGSERWVHEAAVNFHLVDSQGCRVLIEVSGARLLAGEPRRTRLNGSQAREIFALTLEHRAAIESNHHPPVSAGEILLRDGDEIEVVGYKGRVVDATVELRLERDTPMSACLKSGRGRPLIVCIRPTA